MILKEQIKKMISLFLCRYKNVQDFFVAQKDEINLDGYDKTKRIFYDIDNEKDFHNICEKYNFSVPDADVSKRFSEKSHFCVIAEDNHYGCWGWYNAVPQDFYLLEIDRTEKIPQNSAVLFHFFANPDFRRKGYYFDILRNIAIKNGKEYSIIYAYDTNPASSAAMRKSGYKFAGRLNHKTFVSFEELIKNREE